MKDREQGRRSRRRHWYTRRGKRLLDLALTVPGLAALTPVMAGTALVVRAAHGSPVLFRQQRPGLNGAPFDILKFRTMSNETDADGNLLPPEQRVTLVGKILRRTSLDELPELLNVLKGDMSLVGPRPLLMQYLEHYNDEQMRRHDVRPGITGWAQVNGRDEITWEDKFERDVWYVDNLSSALDMKILVKTVLKVLGQQDVGDDAHHFFTGSPGTSDEDSNS